MIEKGLDIDRDKDQRTAVDKWEQKGSCGIIEAPTGFGKTRMAELAIEKIYNILNRRAHVLVVVPNTTLLGQWAQKDIQNAYIKCICVQTLYRRQEPVCYDLVVFDEIHRYASPKFSRSFENVKGEYSLGLTASIDKRMKDIIVKMPIVYSFSVDYCIKKGYIADPTLQISLLPPDENDLEELKKLNKLRDSTGMKTSVYNHMLEELSDKSKIKLNITIKICSKTERKVIIFCTNKRQCYYLSKAINNELGTDVCSVYVSGSDDSVFNEFKDNKNNKRILITCYRVDEGVDIPDAEVAVLFSSSISPVKFIQRIGRVVRASDKKEKFVHALILQGFRDAEQFIDKTCKIYGNMRDKKLSIYYKGKNKKLTSRKMTIGNIIDHKSTTINYFNNFDVNRQKRRVHKQNLRGVIVLNKYSIKTINNRYFSRRYYKI